MTTTISSRVMILALERFLGTLKGLLAGASRAQGRARRCRPIGGAGVSSLGRERRDARVLPAYLVGSRRWRRGTSRP
eukprot:4827595-Pyramimonas_sp.AAC.1